MPIRPTEDPKIKAMQGIHLYHYSKSNCAMRVRMALEEKGLPWTSHYINLDTQDNLTDEYFEIHPHGLVPAMVFNGEIVYESSDILLYLEDKHPEPSLVPADASRLGEMEEWLELAKNLHVKVIKVWVYGTEKYRSKTAESMAEYEKKQPNQELIDFHKMTLQDGHIPQEKVDEADRKLQQLFAQIEEKLQHGPWMVGDKLTLADITWITNYKLLEFLEFDFDRYPRVKDWIQRFISRDSYKKGVEEWFDYEPDQA